MLRDGVARYFGIFRIAVQGLDKSFIRFILVGPFEGQFDCLSRKIIGKAHRFGDIAPEYVAALYRSSQQEAQVCRMKPYVDV